jgi:hypothetical protein
MEIECRKKNTLWKSFPLFSAAKYFNCIALCKWVSEKLSGGENINTMGERKTNLVFASKW